MLHDDIINSPIHKWFKFTKCNYFIVPRTFLQAMPVDWQARFVYCIEQLHTACKHLNVNDNYLVRLVDATGRRVDDPYADYKHPKITSQDLEPLDKPRAKFNTNWIYDAIRGSDMEMSVLGPNVVVYGLSWTPVLLDGDDDPTWVKSMAICILPSLSSKVPSRATMNDFFS